MDGFAGVLPRFLQEKLACLPPKTRADLEELRLREGFPLSAVTAGEEWTHPPWRDHPLSEEDLRRVVEVAGRGSVHTILDQLRSGYVTAAGGVRIGVCGEGAVQDGQLLSFRRITSLALRLPHSLSGLAPPLLPKLKADGRLQSTLILSPPGLGKTTLLRDLIRCISSGEGVAPVRVGVADERGAGRGRAAVSVRPPDRRAGKLPQGNRPSDASAGDGPPGSGGGRDHSPGGYPGHGGGRRVRRDPAGHRPRGSFAELSLRPLYRELLAEGIFKRFVFITLDRGTRRYQVTDGEGYP